MSMSDDLNRALENHARTYILPRVQTFMTLALDAAEPEPQSGALRASRRIRRRVRPGQIGLDIVYGSMHANYTNDGTRAAWIYPRRAQALAFKSNARRNPRTGRFRRSGGIVFAAYVRKPRVPGTHWFTRATSLTAWRRILRQSTSG